MGYLRKSDTVRVDLGDGFWVDLAKHLTHGQYQEAQSYQSRWEAVAVTDPSDPTKAIVRNVNTPDLPGFLRARVALSMRGWNLTDENDKAIDFTPENVDMVLSDMPDPDFDLLAKEVNARNEEPSTAERVDFPAGSGGSVPDGDGDAPAPEPVPSGGGVVDDDGDSIGT